MKRFLIAFAVLLTAAVSPTFAGYIIIRVLLEGGSADSSAPVAGPGGMPGRPPNTMGGSYPGSGPGSGSGSMKGAPSVPGFPGGGPGFGKPTAGAASGTATEQDPTRSIVVVIPLETDLKDGNLDGKKAFNDKDNPRFKKFVAPYNGKLLRASLFVDSSTIQLYDQLIASPAPKKTRHTEMLDKYAQWVHDKKDPQVLYDAMILALRSGNIREALPPADGSAPKDAVTFAQELIEVAAEGRPLPAQVARFVATWGALSKSVRALAPQVPDAEKWKNNLDAKDVVTEGHYSLIFWDSSPTEVKRRLRQLNDNFTAFYLMAAVRGETVPVPAKAFVAVLAKQGQAMRGLHHALDGLPVQSDAFYAPEHDLLVLSPERLDSIGQTFIQQTQHVFGKGLSRDPLLEGLIPKLDHTGEKGAKPNEIARATTLAVVEKLALEETEIAAVSREGTRQLLFATGYLPKHVTLPNWLTSGALSTMSRPRGPAFVTVGDDDKPTMHVALTTGYGVPNYLYQRYFVDLDRHHELNPDSARLLENVLTDAYFSGIKNANDPDPAAPKKKKPAPDTTAAQPPKMSGPMPGDVKTGPSGTGPSMKPPLMGGPGAGPVQAASGAAEEDPAIAQRKKRDRLAIKAQATAWALFAYLDREKPDLLKKYIGELNKLPRDLPIDGQTAYLTFVRVFDLASGTDDHADPQKMKRFASEWLGWIGSQPQVGFDVPIVTPEPPKESSTGPMGPGGGPKQPGGPGIP